MRDPEKETACEGANSSLILPDRSMNRRRVLGIAGAVAGGSITGYADTEGGDSDGHGRVESVPSQNEDEDCELSVFTDEYIGFDVGRPDGWSMDYAGGTIWLWPVEEPSIAAFVYPIRLQPGAELTPAQIVSSYVDALNVGFTGHGGSISLTEDGELEGLLEGAAVRGIIDIDQIGPEDLVIWGGWAPTEAWDRSRKTVQAIGTCYRQRSGRLLTVGTIRGIAPNVTTTWRYVKPDGDDWIVAIATGIDFHIYGDWNPNHEGWNAHVQRAIGALPFSMTPEDFAQYVAWIGMPGDWELTDWRDRSPVFEWTDLLGNVWHIQVFRYDARYNGHTVVGEMIAATLTDGYTTAYVLGVRHVIATEWDRLAAITSTVMANTGSVTTTVTPTDWDPISTVADQYDTTDILMDSYRYREAVRDEAADQWHETTMEFRPLEDRDTGEQFWAPLNNYDPSSHCETGFAREINPVTGETRCLYDPEP